MIILGIGGIQNDPACAVLRDGALAAAAEESKIVRFSVSNRLPDQAIEVCLDLAGVAPAAVDCVAVARPLGEAAGSPTHLQIRSRFPNSRFVVVDHHRAHAASSFYASPFDDATVLTLDRGADFSSGGRWEGKGNELRLDREFYYPDSLGDLYGRVAQLLGFRAGADEHKVQWLSTYGDERYVEVFEQIINLRDRNPLFDRSYFDRDRLSQGGFSPRLYGALGIEDGAAVPESIRSHVAAGLQRAVERSVEAMAGDGKPLCLAGGLGMNTLLVAALERSRPVFVQPAAGNAGTAIGAVLHCWHEIYRRTERVDLRDLCLGPEFTSEQIKQVLENCKLRFRYLLTTDEVIATAIEQINAHRIVAWMHGRMEFGPRALGNRSILASPLNPYSTENLNAFIKHREPFRKFAASVPADLAGEYFEAGPNARYLATVGKVREAHKKTFEAALLGDGHIRVHTVTKADNPLYYRLLMEAGRTTGLPVLYNTSFNLFHDPLVCSPRDAARSFYSSGIDAMFVGNFYLQK